MCVTRVRGVWVSLHRAGASIVGGSGFCGQRAALRPAAGREGGWTPQVWATRMEKQQLILGGPADDLTRPMKGSRQAARLLLSLDVMMGWDSF